MYINEVFLKDNVLWSQTFYGLRKHYQLYKRIHSCKLIYNIDAYTLNNLTRNLDKINIME